MNTHNTRTASQTTSRNQWRHALTVTARRLARRLANYHEAPVRPSAQAQTLLMVEGFQEFFQCALPHASDEIIIGLVELCALESGRARLTNQITQEKENG